MSYQLQLVRYFLSVFISAVEIKTKIKIEIEIEIEIEAK